MNASSLRRAQPTFGGQSGGGGGGGSGRAIDACGSFATRQYNLIHPLMPALEFQYMKAGQIPQVISPTQAPNDGAVEGGGRSPPASTGAFLSASIYQAPATGQGAFSFRARFLAAGIGESNLFGIANPAQTRDLSIGAISSTSLTNYSVSLDGTTQATIDTGIANDLGFHDFTVLWGANLVRVFIDSVACGSAAIGTNLEDVPHYFWMFNSVAGEAVWTELLYGYIPV